MNMFRDEEKRQVRGGNRGVALAAAMEDDASMPATVEEGPKSNLGSFHKQAVFITHFTGRGREPCVCGDDGSSLRPVESGRAGP